MGKHWKNLTAKAGKLRPVLKTLPRKNRWTLSCLIALMTMISLASCATQKPTFNQQTKTLTCPLVKEYQQKFRDRMAAELDSLKKLSIDPPALMEAMKDYREMRRQARICKNRK